MKREAEEDWGVSKRRKDDLQREAKSLGRPAIVLDVDAVARLLRTMVELEGGQTAFASRPWYRAHNHQCHFVRQTARY